MTLSPTRPHAVRIGKLWKLATDLGVVAEEPAKLNTAEKLVCDELYRRLEAAGFVTAEGDAQPFHDTRNNVDVLITGRMNTTVVHTVRLPERQSGSFSILYAAQCALPDIRELLENWER